MSIYDELLARVNERPPRLYELQPQMPGTLALRRMFLSEDLYRRTNEPWESEEFGHLRALMERFVSGGRISLRFPPSKSVQAHFALLDPIAEGAWEIRSRESDPQLRVFGHFAKTDAFVALTWDQRPNLDTHEAWRFAIKASQSQWRRLFSPYKPLVGTNPNDYVSTKCFLV